MRCNTIPIPIPIPIPIHYFVLPQYKNLAKIPLISFVIMWVEGHKLFSFKCLFKFYKKIALYLKNCHIHNEEQDNCLFKQLSSYPNGGQRQLSSTSVQTSTQCKCHTHWFIITHIYLTQ